MATPLVPQEIYLLERYSSVGYFAEMRDAWTLAIDIAERALAAFERALPSDYRNRPLPEQPDIVWGERVLRNFRATRDGLSQGLIELTHGDATALGYASNVLSDFSGFSRDYSSDWLDEAPVTAIVPGANDQFWKALGRATERASNIRSTYHGFWAVGELDKTYDAARGPLNPPAEWPTYRSNPSVRMFTGQPVPRTGIYLPDVSDSVAAFMVEGRPAHQACVGYDATQLQNMTRAPTWWTLVERFSDVGGGQPGAGDSLRAGVRLRCEAGLPCPREGYWFTPAMPGSRQYFSQGKTMPAFSTDFGVTIWQWDEQQGA